MAIAISENFYCTIIENSNALSYAIDLSGTLLYVSPNWHSRLGYETNELVPYPLANVLPQQDVPLLTQALAQLLVGNSSTLVYEQRFCHKQGTHHWYSVNLALVKDADGNLLYIVGNGHDITHYKALAQQLQESADFFTSVTNALPDALFIKDEQHRMVSVNAAYCRLINRTAAEILSGCSDELVPPTELDVFWQSDALALTSTQPLELEEALTDSEGAQHVVITKKVSHTLPNGNKILIGMTRDITEQRRMAEMLAQKDAFLRRLLDAVPDLIFYKDRHGAYVGCNKAHEKLVGLSEQALVGKTNYDLFAPEVAENFAREDQQVLTQKRTLHTEQWLHYPDGNRVIFDTLLTPFGPPDAEPLGLIGICRDITGRKEAEELLRKAKDAAESANQTKSAFLSTVTHELRTPLNGVLGLANLLLDTELNAEQYDLVNTIHSSGTTLLTLINDILDFSKIEANKLDLEPTIFDLRRCLEETLDLVAPQAAAKGLTLTYLIDPAVPTHLRQDITRLRQILVNLLGNAVKFTHQGEITVLVSPHQQSTTDCELHFAVQDTGIGIPTEQFARLFQSFSQVDPSITRRFGGTGLGLAISKRLAELMGGTMWVESEVGRGSIFHFTIQVTPEAQAVTDLEEQLLTLRGRRVCIIEESEALRRLLAQLLTNWAVTPCFLAPDHVQLVEQFSACDVLVLDGALTTCHSLDLVERLQQRYPQLPIVLLTNLGERLTEEQKRPGLVTVSKPLHSSQLHDALVTVTSAQTVAPRKVAQSTLLDATMAEGHPLKILLAEDNMVNQKVAVGLMAKCGYRVDTVGNGLEALEALERQPYDVIFMDVNMPDMDGVTATEAIRTILDMPVQPYIIALTANALPEDYERCQTVGMNDYISKPIQAAELIAALKRVPPPRQQPTTQPQTGGRGDWASESLDDSVAAIDATVLTEIADLMGADGATMVHDLVQLFLQNSPLLLDQLRNALQKVDSGALLRTAHTLRAPAAQVGAYHLAKLCQEIEMGSEAIITHHDTDLLNQLCAEYARVHKYFLATPGPWQNGADLYRTRKESLVTSNEGCFT